LHSFEQRCVTLESSLPQEFLSEGTIVLAWEYEWLHIKLTALSPEIGQPQVIPELSGYAGGKASFDGKWMVSFASTNLAIFASDGKVQHLRNYHDNWGGMQGWLDNERIIFQSLPDKTADLYIYNPFTDKEEIFLSKVSDRYQYDRELSGWYVWKFVPDPTLTRLAYVRAIYKDGKIEFPPALVLVNLETSETLWEWRRATPGERFIPVWSPNGSEMAIASTDYENLEVQTVDRNGESTLWIDIENEILSSSDWVDALSWSPDGRYIAFFGESLYIIDTSERRAYDLCIPYATQTETALFPSNVLTWSPDSTQILFQRGDATAVVIDLESNQAAELVNDLSQRPVAWLTSLP
jgi:WD40 repeat protein